MHLSMFSNDVDGLLNDTVRKMWNDLNPRKKDNSFKKNSLIHNVGKLQCVVRKKEYINKNGAELSERHKNFSDYLAMDGNLERIIKAKPEQFDAIVDEVNSILNSDDLVCNEKMTAFGVYLLNNVFDYTSYRKKPHCFIRYKSLHFQEATCPYCNEGLVKIVRNEQKQRGESRLLFDIDHFYPKHLYPYLALSFYNHIPSCKTCNQTYKGGKNFTVRSHIHPYHRCFDSLYSFMLNHGVLSNEKIKSVKLKKNSDISDLLYSDLELQARYEANVNLARLPKLVEILEKNSHLLKVEAMGSKEFELLMDRLLDFGVIFKKEGILTCPFSKIQRDVVKMFDVNAIVLK